MDDTWNPLEEPEILEFYGLTSCEVISNDDILEMSRETDVGVEAGNDTSNGDMDDEVESGDGKLEMDGDTIEVFDSDDDGETVGDASETDDDEAEVDSKLFSRAVVVLEVLDEMSTTQLGSGQDTETVNDIAVRSVSSNNQATTQMRHAALEQDSQERLNEFDSIEVSDDDKQSLGDDSQDPCHAAVNKPFSCGLCGITCMRFIDLETHMQLHHSQVSYVCNFCREQFDNSTDLKRHCCYNQECVQLITASMSSSYASRRYVCAYCPKRFLTENKCGRHAKFHSGQPAPNVRCETCGAEFTNKRLLKYHTRIVHFVVCNCCGKKFCDASRLARHVAICSSVQICTECKKRFFRPEALQKHLAVGCRRLCPRKHCGCSFCDEQFPSIKELFIHLPVHHDCRVFYVCYRCLHASISEEEAVKHMSTHSTNGNAIGKKLISFLCVNCNRAYSNAKHTVLHAKLKHAEDASSRYIVFLKLKKA